MNILAIDYGTKNIGLAWTDTLIGVVLPFGIVHSLKELVKLINEEKLDKIVVGLPIGVGGSDEKNITRVKEFTKDLEKEIKVPIIFYDERFSSQQADRMIGDASRDEKSAMVILDSFLKHVSS